MTNPLLSHLKDICIFVVVCSTTWHKQSAREYIAVMNPLKHHVLGNQLQIKLFIGPLETNNCDVTGIFIKGTIFCK